MLKNIENTPFFDFHQEKSAFLQFLIYVGLLPSKCLVLFLLTAPEVIGMSRCMWTTCGKLNSDRSDRCFEKAK